MTTDHPGCRETVREGENGLLVPVRDPGATARAIEALLSDPMRRRKMARESRKRAESEFDIRLIARKTLTIYQQVSPEINRAKPY